MMGTSRSNTSVQPIAPAFGWPREINTALVTAMLVVLGYICLSWIVPDFSMPWAVKFADTYIGVAWPLFLVIALFLTYVVGAWVVDIFDLAKPRDWWLIRHALHWASEACPLIGLLTTFLSLLSALLAYGEAGPGKPETQAAFISEFAIAFGSSITGGVLALIAFTLHRITPELSRAFE